MAITYSANNPYTLQELKDHVGAKGGDRDDLLATIANGVTGLVERTCARLMVTRSITERRSGNDRTLIRLWQNPVVAVQALTILRAPADAAPESIASTGYRVIAGFDGGIELFATSFTCGVDNVAITYTAGECASAENRTGLPDDVGLTWLELCQFIASEKFGGATAASSVAIGPQTFLVKPEWPLHVRQGLARLRRASASI